MKKRIITICALIGTIDGALSAADRHVGVAQTYATIQAAVNASSPGDVVHVHTGTYHERVTISGKTSLTLKNADGESPVISGNGLVASAAGVESGLIEIKNSNSIIVSGLTITDYQAPTASQIPVGIHVWNTASMSNIQLINNTISAITNNFATTTVKASAYGIAVRATTASRLTDVVIKSNSLSNLRTGWSESIALNGNVSRFDVSGNTISNCNNIGIDFIGYENGAGVEDRARDGVCRDNVIYDIHTLGRNGAYDTSAAPGIYVDGGANITIERNHVFNTDIGISVGSEKHGYYSDRVTVRSNLIRGFTKFGVVLGGSDDVDNGGATNTWIANNTIYDTSADPDSNDDWECALNVQHYVSSSYIRNNLVVVSWDELFIIKYNTTGSWVSGSIDNNLYCRVTNAVANPGMPPFQWAKADKTWTEWKTLAQDTSSQLWDSQPSAAVLGMVSPSSSLGLVSPDSFALTSASVAKNRGHATAVPKGHLTASDQDLDFFKEAREFGVVDVGMDETNPRIQVAETASSPALVSPYGVQLATAQSERSFIIKNTGVETMTGILASFISFPSPNPFSIVDPVVATLAPGVSDTIRIKVGTSVVTAPTAVLSIVSNSGVDNPFIFNLQGPAILNPVLTNYVATSVMPNDVTIGFIVNPNDSQTTITAECWISGSARQSGVVSLSQVTGAQSVSISGSFSGLIPGLTYNCEIRAVNGGGAAVLSSQFTTGVAASLTNYSESAVTWSGFTVNAGVIAGSSPTTVEVVYSRDGYANETVAFVGVLPAASTTVSLSLPLSGLIPGATYRYHFVGTSAMGVVSGTERIFMVPAMPEVIGMPTVMPVSPTSFVVQGSVSAGPNSNATVSLLYGTSATALTKTVVAVPYVVNDSSPTNVSASLSGLVSGTSYFFRFVAANAGGTASGSIGQFTPSAASAIVVLAPTIHSPTALSMNATVDANGSPASVTIAYGNSSTSLTEIAAVDKPVVTGTAPVSVSAMLSGLTPGATYYYRVSASNNGGTVNAAVKSVVAPWPSGALGTFIGLLPRDSLLNSNLGGRFGITTSSAGTYSGTIVMARVSSSSTSPTVSLAMSSCKLFGRPNSLIVDARSTILRTGKPPLQFACEIDGESGDIVSGSLTQDLATSISFTGWKKQGAVPTGYQGSYTLRLTPDISIAPVAPPPAPPELTAQEEPPPPDSGDPAPLSEEPPPTEEELALASSPPPPETVTNPELPHGLGYAAMSVASDGVVTVSGRVPDGSIFSFSSPISRDGRVLFYGPDYVTKLVSTTTYYNIMGSVAGVLQLQKGVLAGFTDARVPGATLTWNRKLYTSTAVYPTGWDAINVVADGARYTTPTAGTLGGVDTARLSIDSDGIDLPAPLRERTFKVGSTGAGTPQTSGNVTATLTVTPSSGAITGTLTFVDTSLLNPTLTVTRKATYYGRIVNLPDGRVGVGYFLLADRPTGPGTPLTRAGSFILSDVTP